MTNRTNPMLIQRVRHHQEERLQASDLNADMAYEAMLHRLHLRGLHDTWGAALGLRLARRNDGKAALVSPGMAYDRLGRELLLKVSTALDAPVRPAGSQGQALVYDLTVRHLDVDPKKPVPDGGSLCTIIPGLGLEFRWVLAGEVTSQAAQWLADGIRLGEEVPLGRFILNDQDLLSQPSYAHRRNARPLLRPHLAADTVLPAWEADYEQVDEFTTILRSATFTAEINTTNGGFSQDTHYFVRLLLTAELKSFLEDGKLIGPLVSISNPDYLGFTVRVSYALLADPVEQTSLLQKVGSEMEQTSLLWLGAEPVTGCTPGTTQIYTIYGFLAINLASQWTLAIQQLFGT